LVMRCLEKTPAHRWQSSDEILTRLDSLTTPPRGTMVTAALWPVARWRRPGRLVFGVMAAAAVMAVAVWLTRRPPAPELDPRRALVVPFANSTGDARLDGLAGPLETRIKEGLQQTGLVDVIDSRTASARFGVRIPDQVASVDGALELAEGIGAGLVVVGRYLLAAGDSLQVEAVLLDRSDQSEPARISAVRIPRTSPEQGLEQLTERVTGALAVATDPRWGLKYVPGIMAPTFASYREYQRGNEAFTELRYEEAFGHFREAFRMDTTFFPYPVRAAYVLNNASDPRGVDSIVDLLAPRLSRLSEYDRYYLERLQAWNRGDLEAALRAARGMATVAPRSAFAAYTAARSALHVLRPAEAVAGLQGLAHGSDEVPTDDYFGDLTWAYHLLGRYEDEAGAALAWERDPASARPISVAGVWLRVAAARGWEDSVTAMLGRVLSARPSAGTPLDGVLLAAARELRWHGRPEAAATVLKELLRLTEEQAPSIARVEALTMLGRLEEASAAFETLVRGTGDNWQTTAGRGIMAALQGDTAAAERA
ncbi:MAG TPA: hypothetical protein VLL51_02615, partial [Gemmatimonadales bacterium]|nr:hypothetical protein [Gemmatimonadales bacterium]